MAKRPTISASGCLDIADSTIYALENALAKATSLRAVAVQAGLATGDTLNEEEIAQGARNKLLRSLQNLCRRGVLFSERFEAEREQFIEQLVKTVGVWVDVARRKDFEVQVRTAFNHLAMIAQQTIVENGNDTREELPTVIADLQTVGGFIEALKDFPPRAPLEVVRESMVKYVGPLRFKAVYLSYGNKHSRSGDNVLSVVVADR